MHACCRAEKGESDPVSCHDGEKPASSMKGGPIDWVAGRQSQRVGVLPLCDHGKAPTSEGMGARGSEKLMARHSRPTTAGQTGWGGERVTGAETVSLDRKPCPARLNAVMTPVHCDWPTEARTTSPFLRHGVKFGSNSPRVGPCSTRGSNRAATPRGEYMRCPRKEVLALT